MDGPLQRIVFCQTHSFRIQNLFSGETLRLQAKSHSVIVSSFPNAQPCDILFMTELRLSMRVNYQKLISGGHMYKKVSMLIAICFSIISFSYSSATAENERSAILLRIQGGLSDVFEKMDRDLSSVTSRLSTIDFESAEARDILRRCAARTYSVDCVIFDAKGVMKVIEPAEYKRHEGTDLGSDKVLVLLRTTKQPVFSNVFRSVEGINAVVAQYPILSPEKELLGSLSALIKPEVLLANIVAPIIEKTPFSCTVMQKDGLDIYDTDPAQIGRNLFTDPLYKDFPELVDVGRRVVKEEKGSAAYRFLKKGGNETVRKEAVWATVGLYGTEWKIVVISEVGDQNPVRP